MKTIFLTCIFIVSLFADVKLVGNLHPGDNQNSDWIPEDPLTNGLEHTYKYYTDNPTKFYLSQDINISEIKLENAQGIASDSNLKIYIDSNLVATGEDGSSNVIFDYQLSSGYHTIAITGSCYDYQGEEIDCSNGGVSDVDDFYFDGITLVSNQTTTAKTFTTRHHIGDDEDRDDNYDIDDYKNQYYPDVVDNESVTYNINNQDNLYGFKIYISRVRDIHVADSNKVEVYDKNDNLINTFYINHDNTGVFDYEVRYDQNVSGVSKIIVKSGEFDSGGMDDISFDELIFIPFYIPNFSEISSPIIDYRMDECSWDSNPNSYEIKNYGSLGDDYNTTALNEANITDDGVVYYGGDINATDDNDKAILSKTSYALPNSYTINTWIKFPLNTDGHKEFKGNGLGWLRFVNFFGRQRNKNKYMFFNIVDRKSSSKDMIFFSYDTNRDEWKLIVRDDNSADSYDLNPQNLDGWHMLTFVVSDDGTDFYLDKYKKYTFSTHPNSGELGLIFNSDYGSSDNNPNGQSIGSYVDEFELYKKKLDGDTILSIYNNEKNGKNYDGSDRDEPNCGGSTLPEEKKNYKFDIWDDFRDENDRNISTKIVSKEFSFTLAEYNGTSYNDDFNGTVCSVVIDNDGAKISDWNATWWISNDNIKEKNITFKIDKAVKKARVYMYWDKNRYEDSSSCSGFNHENNETNSTDDFAIRPLKFSIDFNTTSFKAAVPFHIDLNATDFSGANAKDYNESNGTAIYNFMLELNSPQNCKNGILDTPNPFKFSDGVLSFDTNYSEVGDVNITIKESDECYKRFASIDCKDSNITDHFNSDTDTRIETNTTKITIDPYQFSIVEYTFLRSPDKNWRYMGDVNESNITISFYIQAQGKNAEVTKNFDGSCYKKSVGFKVDLISTNSDANISYFRKVNNMLFSGHDIALSDINWSDTINDQNFSDGNSSKIVYAINVYKEFDKPISPLDINISDINTTYSGAKNIGLKPDDNGSSFYFARIYTQDIATTLKDDSTFVKVLIYDNVGSNYTKGFAQILPDWYENSYHNSIDLGGVKASLVTSSTKKDAKVIDSSVAYDTNATFKVDINNTNKKIGTFFIHLDISPWLWYAPKGFGNEYNDTTNSTCLEHPCIKYIYNDPDGKDVQSGDFKGVDFDVDVSKNKKGIRIFR